MRCRRGRAVSCPGDFALTAYAGRSRDARPGFTIEHELDVPAVRYGGRNVSEALGVINALPG